MSGVTSERLAEIRVRVEESSEGPWEALPEGGWAVIGSGSDSVIHAYSEHAVCSCGEACDGSPEVAMSIEDIEFVAHARTDVPDLLAHVDHLTAENARLREGIEELAKTGEADGRGNSRDLARHLRTLLNPPTEGEAP